jgi:hypothetical protein
MSQDHLLLPVSIGEALDKLTILDIKCKKITDERKAHCEKEYSTLLADLSGYVSSWPWHYDILREINLSLWEIQDEFHGKDVDEITLGRLCSRILLENDRRFRMKAKINHLADSQLREQKGYAKKKAFVYGHLGLGDMYWLVGAVRYFATCYDKVIVVCKKKYATNVEAIYSDDPTIELFLVEDDIVLHPFQLIHRPYLEEHGLAVFSCGVNSDLVKPEGYYVYEFPYCFYDDLRISREYRTKYFYMAKHTQADEMVNLIKSLAPRYILVHQQSQYNKLPIWDYVEAYTDLPVLDVNENHYPEGHKYYLLASIVVNKPLWVYTKLFEEAEEIHLLESSVYCMASHLDLSRVKDKVCYQAYGGSNERLGIFRTGKLPA